MTRPERIRESKSGPSLLLKADEPSGIVEAIVNLFGIIDGGNDIVHLGSFTKTIAERTRKVRVVDHHNTNSIKDVVGIALEIRELTRAELPIDLQMKFPSATGGLYTKTQYLLQTPEGKGAFDRIVAGAIDEYSIGYEALDVDYTKELGSDGKPIRVRNLRTCRLWEYSPVLWGMNQGTATTSAKEDGVPAPVEVVAEPEPVKESTPAGNIKRVGDTLYAKVMMTFGDNAGWMLAQGTLATEQWQTLTDLFRVQMDAFLASVPEDLALTPVSDYWMYSGDVPDAQKAGRVLSAANAARIKAAADNLMMVLDEAGLNEAAVEDEDESEGKTIESPLAGPDTIPPTDSLQLIRKKLLLRAFASSTVQ